MSFGSTRRTPRPARWHSRRRQRSSTRRIGMVALAGLLAAPLGVFVAAPVATATEPTAAPVSAVSPVASPTAQIQPWAAEPVRTESWGLANRISAPMTANLDIDVPFSSTMPSEAVGDVVEAWRNDTLIASALVANLADPTAHLQISPPESPGLEMLELRYKSQTTPASIKLPVHHLSVVWTVSNVTVELGALPSGLRPSTSSGWMLEATVADQYGPVDGGRVSFRFDGRLFTAPVVAGVARVPMTPGLPVGQYEVIAAYLPPGPHVNGGTDTGTFEVTDIATDITGALNVSSAEIGEAVTYTVHVAERSEGDVQTRAMPPSGTVTLLINGAPVGSAVTLVSGSASLVVPTDTDGIFAVSARFTPEMSDWRESTSAPATLEVLVPVVTPPETTPPVATPPVATAPPVSAPAPELAATGASVNGVLPLFALLVVLAGVGLAARRSRPA